MIPRCVFGFALWATELAGQSPQIRGVVVDGTHAPIPGAAVSIRNTFGTPIARTATTGRGEFAIAPVPPGAYTLAAEAPNFSPRTIAVEVPSKAALEVTLELAVAPIASEAVVTATRGLVDDARTSAALTNVVEREDFRSRPLSNLATVLNHSPGTMVQETTPGQASPFLRGLTGYQTLILIDGVRFNTSTFRSGPNQYLAYVEPSQAEVVESTLGPSAAAFGSDSLGGTIQILTRQVRLSGRSRTIVHGEFAATGASADLSADSAAQLSVAGARIAWLAGGAWTRHNNLRSGAGLDSHNVFRRFFGLGPEQVRSVLGSRLRDTAFSRLGAHTKLALRPSADRNLTVWFQRAAILGLHSYRDLLGGLGHLRSTLEPQRLDLFYARYEQLKLGRLDSLTGTFSVNVQQDDMHRQGLRFTDPVVHDRNRVAAIGYAAQATAHLRENHVAVFGGELYREYIRSHRSQEVVQSGVQVQQRALYPNGSTYSTGGLFAQNTFHTLGERLRLNFGGRVSAAGLQTFDARNRDSLGRSLGVTDSSQRFHDFTFHAGADWRAKPWLGISALIGRGFRAPNLNDLGAIGLTGLGFEVPALQAAAAGALVGTDAGEGALPSGRPLQRLAPEALLNRELGIRLSLRDFYVRLQWFNSDLSNPIVRRTLLFPAGAAPATLASLPVSVVPPTEEQRARGVVGVATAFDARVVKAFVNEGRMRYEGLDIRAELPLSPRWKLGADYSYIAGRELDPDRPVRRLPPQQGSLTLRYLPSNRKIWLAASVHCAGAQTQLSAGDRDDERIGASRRRVDIAEFFRSGVASQYISAGPDRGLQTPDDLFLPTGETLNQIRDRVLPLGSVVNGIAVRDEYSRVPLFRETAGWYSVDLRGGIPIDAHWSVSFGISNAFDRNFRVHGSGADASGRNLYCMLRWTF